MVQDIYPHKMYNQYNANCNITDNDVVLNIVNGNILVYKDLFEKDTLKFPKAKEFDKATEFDKAREYRYLFAIDSTKYYLLEDELKVDQTPEGTFYVAERNIRTANMGPDTEIFAAITGKHIADWYRDTKFCGRCGSKMEHDSKERTMACTNCTYKSYPRIMPAVIVGVINKDKLLITRYKTGFKYNALIAGFTEIGETVEETVAREVMEEAGVKVKNIRYYKSQPWGSANDILLGFFCDVDGDDTITMDSDELKYAEWLRREEIELQPGNYSLTNEMMRLFKEGEYNV